MSQNLFRNTENLDVHENKINPTSQIFQQSLIWNLWRVVTIYWLNLYLTSYILLLINVTRKNDPSHVKTTTVLTEQCAGIPVTDDQTND